MGSNYDAVNQDLWERASQLEAERDRLREVLEVIKEELRQSNGGKGPTSALNVHLLSLVTSALVKRA